MLAFVVLSSSAFVFLMNQQQQQGTDANVSSTIEAQVLKAQAPANVDVSSLTSHDNGLYYTYDEFSKGGGGAPIFVAEYDDYGAQLGTPLGDLIIKNAKEVSATILILGETFNDADLATQEKALEDVTNGKGCNQSDPTNIDFCLILLFQGTTVKDKQFLSVYKFDENGNKELVTNIDPDAINGILSGNDYVLGAVSTSQGVQRSSLTGVSDGPFREPSVLQYTSDVGDYCPVQPPNLEATLTATNSCPTNTENVYVLEMRKATVETNAFTLQSRLINGELPGPTIRVKRGETLRVRFKNNLPVQDGYVKCEGADGKLINKYCGPNDTNLHYHGFHGSGEQPSDDVEMKIEPQSHYDYLSVFTENHAPGTHWIHPHKHGSSALQVGGGASMALIVEDDPATFPIPPEVASAQERVLLVQYFKTDPEAKGTQSVESKSFVTKDFDPIFQFTAKEMEYAKVFTDFRLVNGLYQPQLQFQTNKWQRFRTIYAGWTNSKNGPTLNIKFKNQVKDSPNVCSTYLLAKDGIYINDYPRELEYFPIPLAGTADIMVKCDPGRYDVTHFTGDELLMTLDVTCADDGSGGGTVSCARGTHVASKNFFAQPGFREKYFPGYLQDVREKPVGDGCSCDTLLEQAIDGADKVSNSINGKLYQRNEAVHTVQLNDVIERKIVGVDDHPYHQHVYPFQLTSGFCDPDLQHGCGVKDIGHDKDGNEVDVTQGGYFQDGDWHDNIRSEFQKSIKVKYHPQEILGKMMVHCHRLNHEDSGMMTQEKITHKPCQCYPVTMSRTETVHYDAKISQAVYDNGP